MHGQLPRNLDEMLVDIEQSYRWLNSGDIKGETESTIVAAQDQANGTSYFKNKILKEEIERNCRLCKKKKKTRRNYWPLNLWMPHFGEEWIFETR